MAATPILASISDINVYLEERVIQADEVNTEFLQISVARIVRGYLSPVVPSSTMALWVTPDVTPDTIREIAGMLIASQLFFDKATASTIDIDERHYAQILYDRALVLLDKVLSGEIILDGDVPVTPVEVMSTLDFFPVDDTDRAFTMGQPF
jgi:hypothetical protein